MVIIHYIAWLAIITQIAFTIGMINNFKYTIGRFKRKRDWYRPNTALIVPCKGLDQEFEKNIASFFAQDYNNFCLFFVVEDIADPAYNRLCQLKEKLAHTSQAKDVKILIAGHTLTSSQKIHNLLHAYKNIPDQTQVLAFADSDVCIKDYWLKHIVYPLRQPKVGATSGYRLFVPQKINLPTLSLSALNAKIAQFLGKLISTRHWSNLSHRLM